MKLSRTLLLLFVASVSIGLAHEYGWHMMDGGNWWGYGIGGFIMFLIILIALLGVAAYFIINQKKLRKEYEEDNALEILKQRYASGEITTQQYREMKKELR
jgi:putative membrane protein